MKDKTCSSVFHGECDGDEPELLHSEGVQRSRTRLPEYSFSGEAVVAGDDGGEQVGCFWSFNKFLRHF